MTQIEYMEILLNDLSFSLAQRRDWLEREFGRRYADELSISQRSAAIERLKEMRDERG